MTRHSKEHNHHCKKFEGEFIISTTVGQKDILGDWRTTMVTSPQGHKVPNLFKACDGEKSLAKNQLVGKMVFYWISRKLPERSGGDPTFNLTP